MVITDDILKLCILYFELRNTFNVGFMRYSHFKNMIRYITNFTEHRLIRQAFQKLLNKQYFIKNKSGRATKYHFNPCNRDLPPYSHIVCFD